MQDLAKGETVKVSKSYSITGIDQWESPVLLGPRNTITRIRILLSIS